MLVQSSPTTPAPLPSVEVVTTTLVIVPTYNEIDNIPSLLDRLKATSLASGTAYDVLIVDDGSPDGTADLAARIQAEHPTLHILRRTEKSGLGGAYRAGFAWAMERGYEVLVEMDADHSHPVETIPALLAAVDDGADLAIGSRYVPGGGTDGWSRSRHALSRAGNTYVSLLLWMGVRDATAGFRAYRTDLLRRIDALGSISNGYGFQVELTWRAHRAGATIVEVPITFTERVHGRSKMCARIAAEALLRVTVAAVTRGRRGFKR